MFEIDQQNTVTVKSLIIATLYLEKDIDSNVHNKQEPQKCSAEIWNREK